MRRVKSSPSDLAKMSHNKRQIKRTPYMCSASIPVVIETKTDNKSNNTTDNIAINLV